MQTQSDPRRIDGIAIRGQVETMRPIFHLSFPVRDLSEAVTFYRDELGAEIGRQDPTFVDALLFGAQVTLQDDPGNVLNPMPRTRHFGATISWSEWEALAQRMAGAPNIVEAPRISYAGTSTEQAKLMLRDPSGNLIEVKAYRHPENVLGALASSR
jgi:extradiol dioxygenase family protein